jgi:hypothetical protein
MFLEFCVPTFSAGQYSYFPFTFSKVTILYLHGDWRQNITKTSIVSPIHTEWIVYKQNTMNGKVRQLERDIFIIIIIIIIINIKDWTLWSVPSPKLQLLSPPFLRSSNCSSSLWSAVVWFQRDLVLWHSYIFIGIWKQWFEVCTTRVLNKQVFWFVAPCGWVICYRGFEETCRIHPRGYQSTDGSTTLKMEELRFV